MELNDLLSKLNKVKKSGDKYMSLCPAHQDESLSLSITSDKEKLLVHCFAGCTPEAIVKSLSLELTDLFLNQRTAKPKIVKTYDYTDETGKLLFQVCRLEPKSFRQRHKDGSGQWIYSMSGVRRLIYHLPEVIKSPAVYFCYSPDTEVLTPCGWRCFSNLPKGEPLAQYDTSNGSISFVIPSAYQEFVYNGLIVNIRADWCDLMVTPDHRILAHYRKCRYKIYSAEQIKQQHVIPTAGLLYSNNSPLSTTQARFLIAWLADGHKPKRGKYHFNIKKERKKERLTKLLNELNIGFSTANYPSAPEWTVFWIHRDHVNWLGDYIQNKVWTWDMMFWDLQVREAMLDELSYWDGDNVGITGKRFFTGIKENADIVAAIATLSGWSSIVRQDNHNPTASWIVNLVPKSERTLGLEPQFSQYEGKVYCCTIPSGFLITRRNGKVTIAGNCEGEKDADNLIASGVVATTSPGGANAWRDIYAQPLYNKRVILIPDNDPPGHAYAGQVACSLRGKTNVSCILLPCKDVSDWLNDHDVKELPSMEQPVSALLWGVVDQLRLDNQDLKRRLTQIEQAMKKPEAPQVRRFVRQVGVKVE